MLRLRDDQWERIREHVPEDHTPESRPGHKPVPARDVLEAVLWILNTGAHWHMLPPCDPNSKTVPRRFQQGCEREELRGILTQLANTLREEGALDERERFIDATVTSAKGGGDGIGNIHRGKGVKILAIVDRHGLPLSVSTHAANHHEVTLVQLSVDFSMLEAKPEHRIGDRAYDRDGLDDDLKQDGVNEYDRPAAVHAKTQDPRRPPAAAVPTPLAGRTLLRLAPMEAALADPLGIRRIKLPRLRAAGADYDAAQAILR